MTRGVVAACAAGLLLIALAGAAMAASGDLILPRKGTPPGGEQFPPAAFPHTLHRVLFKCYVCHDSLFKMKRGADEMSMDAIGNGKFCGACHNGKTAFAASSFEKCALCHQ